MRLGSRYQHHRTSSVQNDTTTYRILTVNLFLVTPRVDSDAESDASTTRFLHNDVSPTHAQETNQQPELLLSLNSALVVCTLLPKSRPLY
jgi:hypothetical protein